MSRVLDIIRTLRTTPPLPSVALRILDLVRDQDFSIDELVEIVRTDPSLTARVLRLTNSAMFSVPKEVTSVGDAISFVGTRNLVKLVLVCCAAHQFRNATDSIYGRPEDLWRTAVRRRPRRRRRRHRGRVDAAARTHRRAAHPP